MKKHHFVAISTLAALTATMSGCSLLDNQANLTIAQVVESTLANPDSPQSMTNPVDTSATTCTAALDCAEA